MAKTKRPNSEAKVSEKKGDRAKIWHAELKAAEKREEKWTKNADRVVARYRDEREKNADGERRTNIFWSNTEILKSVLFQTVGNPDVRRRFPKKGKDERAARTAALVLERALSYCADDYDADAQIECVVEDHLIPGRGVAWVVYDADVEETERKEDDKSEGETEPVDIRDQRVRVDHVYWKDYRESAGRKETDIWWKARRHQYSRDELKDYFPDHAGDIPLNAEMEGCPKDKDSEESFKRANIWEIWDRAHKDRIYIAEDYPLILKKDEDPYKLKEFYPCPPALYSVKTTSSRTPIPEFTLYQDQCEELDAITTRLNRLIDALKRRGVYDASADGQDNQLSQLAYADDNQFLPYKGFAALMEKGGLKNVFMTEDLAPIIAVVQQLYEQRATLIQTIYEVTGISDVVRGSSNPNETATAQRIKGQFGSLRITNRQSRVNKFIRDAFRIKGEIIAEHFTREKLQEMTGIDMPLEAEIAAAKQQLAMVQQASQTQQHPGPDGQPMQAAPQPAPEVIEELQAIAKAVSWEAVSDILRSDSRRGYKVDIETEDTAQVDEDTEKQRRIEFLTAMDPVIDKAIMLTQSAPEMLPIAKETVMFAVKGFKVGRQLEETFEDAFDQLASKPAPQQPPNPEMEKVAIEKERAQADIQIKLQSAQADIEGKKIDHQLKQADLQLKGAELQGKQAEMALKAQQMDLEFLGTQLELRNQVAGQEREAEAHAISMDGAKAAQDQKAEASSVALSGARQAQRQKAESAVAKSGAVPSSNPRASSEISPPQSQLQQALMLMVQGLNDLRKSNELVMRAVTAPRTTKLIRDASGRSIGAVQQVLDFDMPAMGNA